MVCVCEREELYRTIFWNVEPWWRCVPACVTKQNVASIQSSCEAGERNEDIMVLIVRWVSYHCTLDDSCMDLSNRTELLSSESDLLSRGESPSASRLRLHFRRQHRTESSFNHRTTSKQQKLHRQDAKDRTYHLASVDDVNTIMHLAHSSEFVFAERQRQVKTRNMWVSERWFDGES